jgi:hypothetical protein
MSHGKNLGSLAKNSRIADKSTRMEKRDHPIPASRKQSRQDLGLACASPDDEIAAIRHSTIL